MGLCRKSPPPGLKIDRGKRSPGTGAKTIRSNGWFCNLKRNRFSPRSMARRNFSLEREAKIGNQTTKIADLTRTLAQIDHYIEQQPRQHQPCSLFSRAFLSQTAIQIRECLQRSAA